MLTTSYFIPTGNFIATRSIVARMVFTFALLVATAFVGASSSARAQGLPGSAGACAPQPSGAVAWYPANGTAEDVQGGNHGTLQSGASFTRGGQVGYAFLLDGVDDFVSVPASPSLNVGAGGGLTVEMWINPSDLGQWRPLVEWHDGSNYQTHFWMNVNLYDAQGPGSLYGNLVEANGTPHYVGTDAHVLTAGVYQHVALTYDKNSGVARIFVNGVEEATKPVGSFTPLTTSNLYLGARPGSTRYQGSMDEVGIYDRALTAAEIKVLVRAEEGRCAYNVVGQVTDECGAPLADVVVNAQTLGGGGTPRSATTDEEGRYSFSTLPAGGSFTFTPQPIQTQGEFVPPSVTFVNLSRDETATFYHRPLMPTTCKAPIVYLSDLSWVSAFNGHGPVELDTSNGEAAAGDGLTITLNGVAYGKGLGAHAHSEIVYDLGGGFSSFLSDIGLDDEIGGNGTVNFRVYADGVLLYESGAMNGNSPTQSVNVSVAGRQQLRLVVDTTGDNHFWDHADWAGARLVR